ncbi:NAD(P)-dependent oxidoreductase [Oceaniglobus trochenteri]|uniref:NAD(P)-dependent oxidoreductase n=1 Tax=Oceaniglobus trochenteri TaxID=2763260 RepID=UPI001CFF55D5|nr:NAD(P)-dependent oxidoreductase [Oceaniglobus trochenteri]
MRTIGIVGVGGMGGGVAERLLDEGCGLVLWNRSGAALDPFRGRDAVEIAASPAEAAASGVVISFVANDAALTDVTESEDGILAGLPADGCHISMSSVSPKLVGELVGKHEVVGRQMIAAPVFGRPEAAQKGLLWVAVSGAAGAVATARPVLECISRSITDFGENPVNAASVKIAGNFMIASAIEAMSEAFAVLEAQGIDSRAFHEMMSETIFGSVIHQNYGRIILDQAFMPPGFKLALGGKDVGLALDMAAAADTPMPFGEILRDRFAAAVAAGRGDEDWNAISTEVRRGESGD